MRVPGSAALALVVLLGAGTAHAFTVDNRSVGDGDASRFQEPDAQAAPGIGAVSPDDALGARGRNPYSPSRRGLPDADRIGHPESHHLFWDNSSRWGRSTSDR